MMKDETLSTTDCISNFLTVVLSVLDSFHARFAKMAGCEISLLPCNLGVTNERVTVVVGHDPTKSTAYDYKGSNSSSH